MNKTEKKSVKNSNLNLSEFVSGGYYIIKSVDKQVWMKADFLPDRVISVSRCLANVLPDVWTIEWVVFEDRERRKKAAEFGLSPHAMIKVIEYLTNSLNDNVIGWPGLFFSIDTAHEFVNAYLNDSSEYEVVGIGLHESFVERFIKYNDQVAEGKYGIYDAISSGSNIDLNGRPLGFELLGYDYGDFHSWLCNSLQGDINREFGVRPNNSGLLDSFKEASQAAEYVQRDEVGAEPGIWMPWLIVEY